MTLTRDENTARDGSKMACGGSQLFRALTAMRGSSKDQNKPRMDEPGVEEFPDARHWLS
jgi:hypothetical protein